MAVITHRSLIEPYRLRRPWLLLGLRPPVKFSDTAWEDYCRLDRNERLEFAGYLDMIVARCAGLMAPVVSLVWPLVVTLAATLLAGLALRLDGEVSKSAALAYLSVVSGVAKILLISVGLLWIFECGRAASDHKRASTWIRAIESARCSVSPTWRYTGTGFWIPRP